ncbi:hypothetical protein ACFW1P_06405 [Paenibacillus sp. NPDC058910]
MWLRPPDCRLDDCGRQIKKALTSRTVKVRAGGAFFAYCEFSNL